MSRAAANLSVGQRSCPCSLSSKVIWGSINFILCCYMVAANTLGPTSAENNSSIS